MGILLRLDIISLTSAKIARVPRQQADAIKSRRSLREQVEFARYLEKRGNRFELQIARTPAKNEWRNRGIIRSLAHVVLTMDELDLILAA